MKLSSLTLALVCAASLAACSNMPAPAPTATIAAAPSPSSVTAGLVAGTAAAAPGLMADVNAVSPAAIAKINAACPGVINGLTVIKSCLGGGAAGSTGAVAQLQTLATSGCGSAAQLAANDAAPVSATNSGNSVAWLNGLLDDAAKLAPLCPYVKAL